MGERHVHADLIHKWCEGAEIQRATLSGNDWVDDSDPTWNICHEYRIKPRTVKRKGWAAIYQRSDGISSIHTIIYDFEDDAKQKCPNAKAIIKVEWEEEVE